MAGDGAQERYALQARFAENAVAYPESVESSRRLCSHGHIDEIFRLRPPGNHGPIGYREAKSGFSL